MDRAGFTIGTTRFGGNRHPFRATLPRHVLRSLPGHEPEVAACIAARGDGLPNAGRRFSRLGLTVQDVKDFLIAYTACLLACLTFLG